MMKEHKVGEKFAMSVNGREVMLEVVPYGGCGGCYFDDDEVCPLDNKPLGSVVGPCSRVRRKDKMSVIFVQVK